MELLKKNDKIKMLFLFYDLIQNKISHEFMN